MYILYICASFFRHRKNGDLFAVVSSGGLVRLRDLVPTAVRAEASGGGARGEDPSFLATEAARAKVWTKGTGVVKCLSVSERFIRLSYIFWSSLEKNDRTK